MARCTRFEAREHLGLLDAEGAVARVQAGTKTFAIDLGTGAATAGDEAPTQRRVAPIDLTELARANWKRAVELGIGADAVPTSVPIEVSGAIITVRDDATTTITVDGRASSIPGEALDVTSVDGSLVAVRTDCDVFVLDASRASVLVSFGYARGAHVLMAAHGDTVAVLVTGALHVVDRDGHWIRVPFPTHAQRVAITDGFVAIIAANELYAIDRSTLLEASNEHGSHRPHDVSLWIAPRADARNDDDVCIVRSALRQFVALTELRTQRHFNLTMEGGEREAQRFAKGERVFVINGRLLKESEIPADFGMPQPELLPATMLPALLPVTQPEVRRVVETPTPPAALAELSRAIGFEPTPLLQQFLARTTDTDWYWPFGVFVPSAETPDLGIPVDPCLVILFDEQSGDCVCTYDYPPARGNGHAFVRFSHEESALIWLGPSFDDALAVALRNELRFSSASTALELLRALNLPINFLDEHPPTNAPAWFETAHPQSSSAESDESPLAVGDRLRQAGDLPGAERHYVRALHETAWSDDLRRPALARLAETYAALGWNFQAGRCGDAGDSARDAK